MSLQFEKLESRDFLRLGKFARRVFCKEALDVLVGTIQNHCNVSVSRGPWFFEQHLCLLLIQWRELIAQPVKRGPQWCPPRLIPARLPSGITSAVGLPPLNTMHTTPR